MRYTYRGDKLTRPELKGRQCDPIRRPDGKCITSRLATMLVIFDDGTLSVVMRRQLRINK